jgi:hypothetical protein
MGEEYRTDKLNSTNYRYWALRAQGLLEAKGVWEAIDPGYGDVMTTAEKQKDHKARSIFYLIINDEGLDDIIDCERAKDIWDVLKQIHTKYDTWHGLLLLKDFVTTQMKPDEKIGEYLTRRNGLYHKVKHAGYTFDEKIQAGFAALGLPPGYEYLVRNLRADKDDLNMASLKAKLLEEERRIGDKQARDDEMSDDVKALWTRGKGNNGNYNRDNDKAAQHAGKPPSKANDRDDHKRDDRSQKGLKCYSCLEFGHISRNCPHKSGGKDEKPHVKQVHTATALSAAKGQKKLKHDLWVLDSGATDHMSSSREKFVTFVTHANTVEVAGGQKLESSGYGDIEVTLAKTNGGCLLSIKDVLFVPKLDGNLLSVPRITEKGLDVTMRNESAYIQEKDGSLIAEGFKEGQLYRFYESRDKSAGSNSQNGAATYKVTSKNADLWHRRLGHLHIAAVKDVVGGDEIRCNKDAEKRTENCETCMKGKLKATPFPKKSFTREKEPLMLVHSDVAGPIKPISKGGNRYFVTFIDDYSRHTVVYPIKAE